MNIRYFSKSFLEFYDKYKIQMIHDTNDMFDFKQNVKFITPKSVSSGCYFIRCFGQNQNPLYIQYPKCKSKQGIVTTGKKMHCDLIFTHDDEAFLRWIEDFENQCQTVLFENRSKWFDSDLEMHDIESSFASSFKIYKSQHVLRANIPIRLGKCALKIYDEQEQDIDIENILNDTSLMTILEIQGIKCSSRSFQIDFEIKQMMVLNPVDLFEKCIISKKPIQKVIKEVVVQKEEEEVLKEEVLKEEDLQKEDVLKKEEEEDLHNEEEANNNIIQETKIEDEKKEINLGISDELYEIQFSLPTEDNEVVHLKKRNDVYFEMYSSAKRKAKLARQYALSAYLEANRIKNTYLLDEVFEEDEDDDDDEIYKKWNNNIQKTEEDDDIFNLTTKK